MIDITSFNDVLKSLNCYTDIDKRAYHKFIVVEKPDKKAALVTFDESRDMRMILAANTAEQLVLALYTPMIIGTHDRIYRTLVEALGIVLAAPYLDKSVLSEQVLDTSTLEVQVENLVWCISTNK